ncbi:MAG TPA: hypothetical protein VFS00_15190, partial [Polyangiaceae bacterium]|nr:hypothetical protein [Polyangiaceae bacterium]
PVLVAGGLVAAAGGAWLSHVTSQAPDFLTLWLPGMVLTGAGVGLVLPAVGGASTATLPARSFAVGGAVNQAVRQFGAVLGVALVVALLSAAGVGGERDALGKAYAAFGALGFVASLCGLGLGAARSVRRAPMGESIRAPAFVFEPAPELEPEPAPASMPAPDSGARTTLVTGVEPAPAPGSRFAPAAPVSSRGPESRPAPVLAPVSSRGPESKRAPESRPASIPAPVSARGPESKRAPASIPAPASSRGPESKPAPASEPEGAAT